MNGNYFLKSFVDGGHFLPVRRHNGQGLQLEFETDQYQQSIVTLELAADFLTFIINT